MYWWDPLSYSHVYLKYYLRSKVFSSGKICRKNVLVILIEKQRPKCKRISRRICKTQIWKYIQVTWYLSGNDDNKLRTNLSLEQCVWSRVILKSSESQFFETKSKLALEKNQVKGFAFYFALSQIDRLQSSQKPIQGMYSSMEIYTHWLWVDVIINTSFSKSLQHWQNHDCIEQQKRHGCFKFVVTFTVGPKHTKSPDYPLNRSWFLFLS